MASVCGGGILSHWSKTKLKTRRLRESRINQDRLLCVSAGVLHLDEEGEDEESVYGCGAAVKVEVEGPSPLVSLLGEKAPGASFVTTAVAFRLSVLHFLLIPVCSSL